MNKVTTLLQADERLSKIMLWYILSLNIPEINISLTEFINKLEEKA